MFVFARIMHCIVGVERALMRTAFIFCLVLWFCKREEKCPRLVPLYGVIAKDTGTWNGHALTIRRSYRITLSIWTCNWRRGPARPVSYLPKLIFWL